MKPEYRQPVNVSQARDPKWTGAEGEYAVIVSRGEPRRTDEQVYDVVRGQIERYLLGFTDDFDGDLEVVYGATELIAQDYIYPLGSQGVRLQRESILKYVQTAKQKLGKL